MLSPKAPMCFEFLLKNYKFSPKDPKWQTCFKNKKSFLFENFPPNLWKIHFLEILSPKHLLFKKKKKKKKHFSPKDLCFCNFCLTKCPLQLKIGALHSHLFYMLLLPPMNKTKAIPKLVDPRKFFWLPYIQYNKCNFL